MERKTAFLMATIMALTSAFADGMTAFALESETVVESTETTEPVMKEAEPNVAGETVMSDDIVTDETVGETTDEMADQIAETTSTQSDIDGTQDIDFADEMSLIDEIEIVDSGAVTAQETTTEGAKTIHLNETVRVTLAADNTEDAPLNFVFRNEERAGDCRYIAKISNVENKTDAVLKMRGKFGNGSVEFDLYDNSYNEYDDSPYNELCSHDVTMSDFSIIELWPYEYPSWEEGMQSTFDLTIIEAPNNSNAKNMDLGFAEAFSIGMEDLFEAYKYTPTVSGRYTMYIDYSVDFLLTEINLYGELDPAYMSESLCHGVDTLTYSLEAGKTYYYVITRNTSEIMSGVVHFIKTPNITDAKLISNPIKREYVKGTDTSVDWTGMKIQVNYSDGRYSELMPVANNYATNIKYTDKYGNPIYCKTYNADMEGDQNSTYNSDYFQISENTPAGTYYMCADVYECIGDDDTFVTRVPVSFVIVDPGQQAHIWGKWETKIPATAVEEGEMMRTCTLCAATDTMPIDKLPATLKLNVTSIKLKTKQSTSKVKVSGLARGDAVASWKSSNPKIVTVNGRGKITAKSKTGKATITVTLKSGMTGEIKVTVQKKAVACTKVTLNKKSVTLKKGKKFTLKPTVTPLTCVQKVKYSSSKKSVATVSSKGVIKAKKKGSATITVTVGKKKVKCKVKVK